jgi:hypothetical protein
MVFVAVALKLAVFGVAAVEFARLVRRTLMDRRTIKDLRSPPEPAPRICIDQLVLL